MAYVASNNTNTNPKPFMDRVTHAVIKETSKNLKYYIDVKRRENAFILNPNSSVCDLTPLKSRLIYGTTKEYSSLSGSYYTDKDIKNLLPNFQQKQKQFYSTSISPEKQMCREELNFHMRSYNFSPKENPKFSELRIRPTIRASSSCSTNRDIRPRSAFKLTRHEQDQLIDDTADILVSMVKSRRSIYEPNFLTRQTPPIYISRNTNPSPQQIEYLPDQSNFQPLKTEKRSSKDILSKPTFIIPKSKLITKGFLCEYKISITTGNCNGASTNARIRIKLYGKIGHTNFNELIHSETHRIPFLKNQTDIFTLQTYHVGQLIGITIGHNRKDMRASWFLNKISIDDPIGNIIYHIPCNAWLSIKSNDQKTMRNFQVISMISYKKMINSNEHREENGSQSDYSTTITEGIITPNATNSSENDLLTNHKKTRKYRKQQHVSIGPTTIDELPPPPVFVRQIRTPMFSTTSSDTEMEGNITNHTRSTTPTPSPTLNQTRLQSVSEHDTLQIKSINDIFKRHSIDYDRPPARLEKRTSPLSISPERANKNNENNVFSFFE